MRFELMHTVVHFCDEPTNSNSLIYQLELKLRPLYDLVYCITLAGSWKSHFVHFNWNAGSARFMLTSSPLQTMELRSRLWYLNTDSCDRETGY